MSDLTRGDLVEWRRRGQYATTGFGFVIRTSDTDVHLEPLTGATDGELENEAA